MKKIMFSDAYGLTEAVLSGRKTKTRRIASKFIPDATQIGFNRLEIFNGKELRCYNEAGTFIKYKLPYQIGEVVAVAQSYADAGFGDTAPIIGLDENDMPIFASEAGVYNKMFVRADLMPHQICITNVRVERLQDISDEDCIKEGICIWTKDRELFKYDLYEGAEMFSWSEKPKKPHEAYAALIDRIAGRRVWSNNPFVFVYDFELIK